MPNTLTDLIPDAYAALDVVSRELVGFIPHVNRDPSTDRVAVGQTVRAPQTAANTAGGDVTAAMALPAAAYQTVGNKGITITKSRFFPFSWTGEEQYAMDKGPGFLTIQQDQIAQAMRAGVNEMEADLADAAYKAASRAYGTAGTTPFATDLSDPAQMKKILDDNGAPPSDRHLCINTTAGAKMRSLAQLTKVNEAGSADPVRRGTLLDLDGFMIRESAQIKNHTKGTGAAYVTSGSHAVGAMTIAVITGTGTILAGDVVTFAGDTNKYVVKTGLTGPGSFVINEPGLFTTIANGTAVTVGNNYAANVAHTRQSIQLATRLPALPKEGDLAIDRYTITDPVSGISFEIAAYPGYRMITYQVLIAWGLLAVKPEHIANLLG